MLDGQHVQERKVDVLVPTYWAGAKQTKKDSLSFGFCKRMLELEISVFGNRVLRS